jgi:hypothetical protein
MENFNQNGNSQNGSEELQKIPIDQLFELTELTEKIPQGFADTSEALKAELNSVTTAINTWERLAPKLYFMKKRLLVIDEILSGKRDVESILSVSAAEDKPEKKKRGPQKGKKAFIRRKSDILNDNVIEKIRDFISIDEEYHKSKEIYAYLVQNNLIPPYPGNTPDRVFAISLSRVDQDDIKYNNHYSIMAWGLPDFGTPEHARRKALKQSVKGKEGTRVSSYGRKETEMSDLAVGV